MALIMLRIKIKSVLDAKYNKTERKTKKKKDRQCLQDSTKTKREQLQIAVYLTGGELLR